MVSSIGADHALDPLVGRSSARLRPASSRVGAVSDSSISGTRVRFWPPGFTSRWSSVDGADVAGDATAFRVEARHDQRVVERLCGFERLEPRNSTAAAVAAARNASWRRANIGMPSCGPAGVVTPLVDVVRPAGGDARGRVDLRAGSSIARCVAAYASASAARTSDSTLLVRELRASPRRPRASPSEYAFTNGSSVASHCGFGTGPNAISSSRPFELRQQVAGHAVDPREQRGEVLVLERRLAGDEVLRQRLGHRQERRTGPEGSRARRTTTGARQSTASPQGTSWVSPKPR